MHCSNREGLIAQISRCALPGIKRRSGTEAVTHEAHKRGWGRTSSCSEQFGAAEKLAHANIGYALRILPRLKERQRRLALFTRADNRVTERMMLAAARALNRVGHYWKSTLLSVQPRAEDTLSMLRAIGVQLSPTAEGRIASQNRGKPDLA